MTEEHRLQLEAKVKEIRDEQTRHEANIAKLNHDLSKLMLNFDNYTEFYVFTYKHSLNLREFFTTTFKLRPMFLDRVDGN